MFNACSIAFYAILIHFTSCSLCSMILMAFSSSKGWPAWGSDGHQEDLLGRLQGAFIARHDFEVVLRVRG